MAVQISGVSHNFSYAQRFVFRASDGTVYVVLYTNNLVKVAASNGVNPSSFALYSSADQGAPILGASGAIGSDDIIHISFHVSLAASTDIRYITFNCATKTFTASVIINGDIGADPAGFYLYNALSIDSNNIPHIVSNETPSIMGSTSLSAMYRNRIGGAWNTAVTVRAVQSELDYQVDIQINANNIPIISMVELTGGASPGTRTLYKGNTNNATSFTRYTGLSDPSQKASLLIDDKNIEWLAFIINSTNYISVGYLSGTSLASYSSTITCGTPPRLSAFITGTSLYIFYKNTSTGLSYVIFDTVAHTFGTPVVIETGDYNSQSPGWQFWHQRDSVGLVKSPITGRFDGSGTAGDAAWVNPSNIFDNNESTLGSLNEIGTHYITRGTNFGTYSDSEYPIGTVICKVKQSVSEIHANNLFRIYQASPNTLLGELPLTTTAQWSTFTLNTPSGGWTWAILKALVPLVYSTYGPPTINIYEIQLIPLITKIPVEIDYVFMDAAGAYPYYNKVSLVIPTAWLTKSLKWYNGSSWVGKPLKYHNGASWVTKPVKINM